MARIKRHRYNKEESGSLMATTHRIAIGIEGVHPKTKKMAPKKLFGFAIFSTSLDSDNHKIPDHNTMQRLHPKYEPKGLIKATKEGLGIDPATCLLPVTLKFVIRGGATLDGSGWTFPGTYDSELTSKSNSFSCRGNGLSATRREGDGLSKQIKCTPVGVSLSDGEEHCKYSVDKKCKARGRIVVGLYFEDVNKKKIAASRSLGFGASYLFKTSADNVIRDIEEELDYAATRTGGRIDGLTGCLLFAKERRETGDKDFPTGTVGTVKFVIDPESIATRVAALAQAQQEIREFELGMREVKQVSYTESKPAGEEGKREALTVLPDAPQVKPAEEVTPPGDELVEPPPVVAKTRIQIDINDTTMEQLLESLITYVYQNNLKWEDTVVFEHPPGSGAVVSVPPDRYRDALTKGDEAIEAARLRLLAVVLSIKTDPNDEPLGIWVDSETGAL